jgi:multidrug efflux pump subunit AcrA (membrane-fusion protein)
VDESDYGRVLNISPVTALPEMPGLRQTVASGDEELARRSGRVTLTVDAFPEETFEGVIERVEPQGKLSQGSAIIQYDVHVAVTDENVRKLPLGAQAQVEFTIESAPNALRVPSEAVRNHQGQRGVWIVVDPEPGSRAKWGQKFVACRFGITDGEFTQVTAVLGDFQLKPGLRVYTKLPVDQDERER